MNYIELINNFWTKNREIGFNSNEATLYFYILNESNRAKWKNPIQISTNILCAELGISRKTLINSREKLFKHDLLKYVSGIKNQKKAVYEILYVSAGNMNGNIDGNINGNMNGNIDGNINGNMNGNHLNKTKHKQNINKTKFIEPTQIEVFSFFSDKYKNLSEGNIKEVSEKFYNFYESKGWMVGKNKMSNWKAAAARWDINERNKNKPDKESLLSQLERSYKYGMEMLEKEQRFFEAEEIKSENIEK